MGDDPLPPAERGGGPGQATHTAPPAPAGHAPAPPWPHEGSASTRLTVHDPALGLVQHLRDDRTATAPVRPWPRVAAVAVAALASVLWLLALRSAAAGAPWPSMGLPAAAWAFLAAVVGAGAYVAMARIWPGRELRLRLAQDQQAQLAAIEAQVTEMRRFVWGGAAAVATGIFVLAAAFAWSGMAPRASLVVFGSVLAASGAVVATVGLARSAPVRTLYVQTLMLHRLEMLGWGDRLAMDPRTADVLVALDGLLGELPESSVRRFLSRPEAEWYLELIAKLKEERRGR